jgi:hypoxanthine phosphoribosyltransferase
MTENERRGNVQQDIEEILISADHLERRVAELGDEITKAYAGKDLLMVAVLKGAVTFMVDLARQIRLPLEIDFMAVSSYGASTQSSGVVRILKDLDTPISGKHLLVVEDIIDTGLTLQYILRNLKTRQPASVRVCGLLFKDKPRPVEVRRDFVGFTIPDRFVVGYGLDFAERYRNLPYIGILKPSIYSSRGAEAAP